MGRLRTSLDCAHFPLSFVNQNCSSFSNSHKPGLRLSLFHYSLLNRFTPVPPFPTNINIVRNFETESLLPKPMAASPFLFLFSTILFLTSGFFPLIYSNVYYTVFLSPEISAFL